jgi:branched-chain amino acid transport system ATP-binding protein
VTDAVLKVDGVSVSYGKISAVRNVAVDVKAGQIVTIIGPNGAGKSSLLKGIMGMIRSSGSVLYEGKAINQLDLEERVERGLILVPETRELFTEMSVHDNLMLGAYAHRRDKFRNAAELEKVYALFPRLLERRQQAAGTMSGGERQMLALGRALMSRPKVLMLDEPSLGLAPIIVQEIFRIIDKLRESGVSTLLVEQNARAALNTADYGYVLETGDVVRQGNAKDLLHDESLTKLYLGGEIDPIAHSPIQQ